MRINRIPVKWLLGLFICSLSFLLQAQCPDPKLNDPAGFSCKAINVTIQEKIPTNGTGLLTSGWTQSNSEGGSAITNDWSVAFMGGLDACGQPSHNNVPDVGPLVWPKLGISDSITNEFPTGNKENAQQDGWLLIPISYDCIDFRLGGVDKGEASALFAGTSCDNMTLVGENNTLITGLTNDFSYTLPTGLPITSSASCDYFLIRIRLYHNDPGFDESNSEVEWDLGEGFEIIPINYLLPVSDHQADDLIPTSISEVNGASLTGLYDEYEKLWELPVDCEQAPTSLINIPYICYSVEENSGVTCDPCAIEMQEIGCICDNTSNTFASRNPQSVSVFQQSLLVTSLVDDAYTISNVEGLLSGPTLVNNTNSDVVEYTYTVSPGMAYSFSLTGTTSGVTVVHSGGCALVDDCNCPPKSEICGDNLDNDFDGATDAADTDIIGNCQLDCQTTPLKVQGKVPVADGKVLTQIWSEACGNFCCTGLANTQQSPIGLAGSLGGAATNGSRPLLIPFTSPIGTGTGYSPTTLPRHINGAAGCVLRQNTLGLEESLIADKMSRGRGDQVQMDAWLILPSGVTCVDFRINNPQAHDGAALFLGPSIQDMDFIGAAWGLQGAYVYDTSLDGSTTQSAGNFQYNPVADGVALISPDPGCPSCGFYAIRARWYGSDVSTWMNGVVQWNYGEGWENIPATNLQSVGSAAASADSDNNKPNQLKNGIPFCVYQDEDKDLFTAEGQPFSLSKRYCESIQNITCLNCPAQLSACIEDCVETLVSANALPANDFPTCFLEVFNLTPKTISSTGSLYTQFWDGNNGNGFTRQISNNSISAAFDIFPNGETCQNCLPEHPNAPSRVYQSTTLGVDDAVLENADKDGDDFQAHIKNLNGGENIQQDGWLLIPSNISCIDFKLGGGSAYDASRLYLGIHPDTMSYIGENINQKGENDFTILTYEIPANAPIIDEDCDNLLLPLRAVRLRFYHHDNSVGANTIVQWNIGRGFVDIPNTHLRSVANECDATLPSTPTYTDGAVTKVVRDEEGRFFLYDDFPTTQPSQGNYEAIPLKIDRFDTKDCYTLNLICGNEMESIEDPKALCTTCIERYPSISDPCICLDNGGVGVGQYAETVMVTDVSDKVWYIKSVTGLTQAPAGAFPPATGIVYPIIPFGTGPTGVKMTEIKQANGISSYILNGLHIDNIGYFITVSDGTTDLSIGNKCTGCEKVNALNNSSFISSCGEKYSDDGSNDGNYIDTIGQKIYTFCPDNPAKQSIRLQFTQFEIATGDTFRVYTGNHIYSNNYLELSGESVGQIEVKQGVGATIPQGGGGWVAANCNNLSGCLTIRWQPNGDNVKGAGWMLKTECIDQSPMIENCSINDYSVTCEEGKLKIGKIATPKITLQNICAQDTSYYLEYQIDHQNPIQENIDIDSLELDTLGLGTHALAIRLRFLGLDGIRGTSDDSVCIERTCVFTIGSPYLPSCNDSLILSLGAACKTPIRPDDLLENPDTNGNHYIIKITPIDEGKETDGIIDNETNKVILSQAGTYNYTITDACKQTCSGKITLLDTSSPIFLEAEKDTLITCAVELSETGLGLVKPLVVDNCDTLDAVFIEAKYIKEGGVCDTNIVNVVWEATDQSGNQARLNQEVLIIRPDLSKLIKTQDIELSCGEDDAQTINNLQKTGVLGLQTGRIRKGAFIALDTLDLSIEDYVCGYILQEETVTVQGTTCGNKYFRHWSLLDWCANNAPLSIDTQNIFLADTLAPVFTENQIDAITEIMLDPFSCTYDAQKMERPAVTDNCNIPTVQLDSVFQLKGGLKIALSDSVHTKLTCDTFLLKWIAADACIEQKKTAIQYQKIVIVDETAPTVKMNAEVQLSLTGENTVVGAEELDDGSFDACGIAKYEIRIRNSAQEWGSVTSIPCNYLTDDLELELKVTDIKGNENIGWIAVNTEDKIDPICSLKDYELDCDVYHRGQFGAVTDTDNDGETDAGEYIDLTDSLIHFYNEAFGYPICQDDRLTNDTCGVLTIEQQYFLQEQDCGGLKIKRRARAIDGSGNKSFWAIQNIIIKAKADWSVVLPADWEGTCGETTPAAEIVLQGGACDRLASEVTERYFELPGEACFKIERTYHIINWCQYDTKPNTVSIERLENDQQWAASQTISATEELLNAGQMTYIQILKIHDEAAPVISITSPDSCITGIEFDALPYGVEDQTPLFPPYECDELKVWRAHAIDCSSDEAFRWEGRLYDAQNNELLRVDSPVISYPVYDEDIYYVKFWAYDACGNAANLVSEKTSFRDCRQPIPYIKNGIILELSEQSTVEVWAKDLDQSSFDNCTPQRDLITKIWHHSLGESPTSKAEVRALPTSISFNCQYVGHQEVHIYVMDRAGNWDFATTFVAIQDNNGLCGDPIADQSLISGTISNSKGENIEGVSMKITGPSTYEMTTGTDGLYQFLLSQKGRYQLQPQKTINPLNGVSTFDLVVISQHILGIKSFSSPYQFIAADVNKSGGVTTFDMVQLRQLILGIIPDFPNNESWRFVEKTYDFHTSNPADEPFREQMEIDLPNQGLSYDFIGIKIGDVNGSAQANAFSVSTSRKQKNPFTININDRKLYKGELVKIDFTSKQLEQILGYQFTLNYKDLQFIAIENAEEHFFNLNKADSGTIKTSWNGHPLNGNTLFTLQFKATKSAWLSELLTINQKEMLAEAYTIKEGELRPMLHFNPPTTPIFKLYQNQPNPFNGKTQITFDLPKATAVKLEIMDIQGHLLKSIKRDFNQGRQYIIIDAKKLKTTGVLYYQLTAGDFVGVKKMIVLE